MLIWNKREFYSSGSIDPSLRQETKATERQGEVNFMNERYLSFISVFPLPTFPAPPPAPSPNRTHFLLLL
jgi:hypothetical protein